MLFWETVKHYTPLNARPIARHCFEQWPWWWEAYLVALGTWSTVRVDLKDQLDEWLDILVQNSTFDTVWIGHTLCQWSTSGRSRTTQWLQRLSCTLTDMRCHNDWKCCRFVHLFADNLPAETSLCIVQQFENHNPMKPVGSMVMVYLPTWMIDLCGECWYYEYICARKYTIHGWHGRPYQLTTNHKDSRSLAQKIARKLKWNHVPSQKSKCKDTLQGTNIPHPKGSRLGTF